MLATSMLTRTPSQTQSQRTIIGCRRGFAVVPLFGHSDDALVAVNLESVPTGGRGGRLGEIVMQYDQRVMMGRCGFCAAMGRESVSLKTSLVLVHPMVSERTGVTLLLDQCDTLWVDMPPKWRAVFVKERLIASLSLFRR